MIKGSHATEKVDGCCLASAIVAQKREHMAFANAETDAVDCKLVVGALVQSVFAEHFDQTRHFYGSSRRGGARFRDTIGRRDRCSGGVRAKQLPPVRWAEHEPDGQFDSVFTGEDVVEVPRDDQMDDCIGVQPSN